MQSLGGVLGRLEDLAVFGLPDDWFERQLAALGAIDATEIQRVARQHLDAEQALVLAVGPASELAPSFERFGRVEVTATAPMAA